MVYYFCQKLVDVRVWLQEAVLWVDTSEFLFGFTIHFTE